MKSRDLESYPDPGGIKHLLRYFPYNLRTLGAQSERDVLDVLAAVRSTDPVSGLTHTFYRYPARWSPVFVRAAIERFTKPGDVVCDPFLGGGTTLVEALSLGRRFVGADLNPLSVFVSQAKSTMLTTEEVKALTRWTMVNVAKTNIVAPRSRESDWAEYQKDVPWWLRKTLEIALGRLQKLPSNAAQIFARATLLRTAQWALDSRRTIPTKSEFLQRHQADVAEMIGGMLDLQRSVRERFRIPPRRAVSANARIFNCSAVDLTQEAFPRDWAPPKLVLTSPPYWGVHILYHRWQVQGRRETAAPFWIAGYPDGKGPSFYTFAARQAEQDYLAEATACFSSIERIMGGRSTLAQLVGFSRPRKQLPAYLGMLAAVGLRETTGCELGRQRRVSRAVPNRKWYVNSSPEPNTREFFLIHRRA